VNTQTNIREQVTNKIVAALRAGTPPWRQPWSGTANAGLPTNVASNKSYSGVNTLILSMVSAEREYRSKFWGTFNQWKALGLRVMSRPANVIPGGWGTRVVFCKAVSKTPVRVHADRVEGDEDADPGRTFLVLREYTVFNAEQVEGDGIEAYQATASPTAAFIGYGPAERVLAVTGADIRYGGAKAVYVADGDYIRLPEPEAFTAPHEFYGTAFHELVHWSGHPSRLDRLARNDRFGSTSYAREELVAEIGGCLLSAEIGVPQSDDLTNQAAYLNSWLSILGHDPTAIFTAAAQASAAVDFLLHHDRQPGECNSAGVVGAAA
jgi:antirestriction protein ArdC